MPDDITPPSTPAPEATPASTPPATPPAAATPPPATPPPAADPWVSFKPVEGYDAEQAKGLVEFVKKNGGGPEIASALMKRDMEVAKASEEQFKYMSEKGWLEELQKDPELGGEKVRETMVDTMRAFDRLPPALQLTIKEQGVLYNPIVVRLLHHFGVGFREATHVRPGATPATSQVRSMDDRLMDIFTPKK